MPSHLERREEHGAVWREAYLSGDVAIVDLCTCAGEPVDRLGSGDPDLIASSAAGRTAANWTNRQVRPPSGHLR